MRGFIIYNNMKIDKIVYDVREGIRQFTDDSEISDRYIIHLVNINRAEYISQLLNNFQRITPSTITQSFCEELELVSASDCGISDCETVLRTKRPIPLPLDLHTKSAITSIRPSKKLANKFVFTTRERALFTKFAPFKNTISAFLDSDGYIYVTGNQATHKLIDCLSITGIFEDPTELSEFNDCCGCDTAKPCFDMSNTDYPIPSRLIKVVRDSVINQIMQSMQIPTDKVNNSDEQ